MKKILSVMSIVLLLSIGLVSAITQQEINEAKALIDSKVACDKLTNEQLEILGEYYMEQMHPGESHELMHKMMGLEAGSEAEEQFHIDMAKAIYCGEGGMMGSGSMMGMMPMMMNMMMGQQNLQSNPMQQMMGASYFGYWNFLNTLYVILIIGLIALVYLGIIKITKDLKTKRR